MTARATSPLSTGGAGTTYEYRVAGVALVALLRGDRIPGLGGPVTRVGLQQRFAGHILDDVVAHTTLASGEAQTIEYQMKRTCNPVKSKAEFLDVVTQCVAAIRADPKRVSTGHRQLGLAALRPVRQLAALADLTGIARSHATPGSFAAFLGSGVVSSVVRDRHTHLHEMVRVIMTHDGTATAQVIEDMTWRVARALHVWQVEVDGDGRDAREASNRLADLLPGGQDAAATFGEIVEAAQEWGPRGGMIDGPMLRAALEKRGIALTAAPVHRAALASLQEATPQSIEPGFATLGRSLHLPRATLRDQLTDAVVHHELVLVTGRAGAGKSVLTRLVAQRLRNEGAVVVAIPLTGRSGGMAQIEEELGVPLVTTLRCAPTGVLRILVIDGAEQALTDAGRLLTSLLAAVPMNSEIAPPWHVVLTARDEAADAIGEIVLRAVGHGRPQTFSVGDLTDDEIGEVLAAFPRLQPLDRHERPRALLLRRPYLVDLLLRSSETLDLPSQLLGEEDVVELVYDRLVRLASGALPGRGSPEARSDVYLAMADKAFRNQIPARLEGADAEARAGLVSDDVLVRVRANYQFAHDIVADYAATTRLLEADGENLLATATTPRRLLRTARLWMQHRLADVLEEGPASVWTRSLEVATGLAERDGPRWHDVPYEALLNLGAARQTLDALTPTLLDSNAIGLQRLVDVTERLARQRQPSGDALALPLDLVLSAPIVDLLAILSDRVPSHVRQQATRLVRGHLVAAAKSGRAPDHGLQQAARLHSALVTWGKDLNWGEQLDHTIEALALLAQHISTEAESFLLQHARARPDRLSFAVETTHGARQLAKWRPAFLLLMAGHYYLGRGLTLTGEDIVPGRRPPSRRRPVDDGEDGVRDHSARHQRLGLLGIGAPAGPLGPFSALLAADPSYGFLLVGSVVDTATRARISVESEFGQRPLALDLQLPGWPAERRFWGTAHVWQWYRRLGVGAYPAMSALIALREWAVARVRTGETLSSVVARILGCGESLALIAVTVSVLVDAIDRVDDELDPFLEHPLLWRLEVARTRGENSGLAHRVPNAPRLTWTFSQVAAGLVMNGTPDQRNRLRRVGQRLVEYHAELVAESEDAIDADESLRQAELLARRWAAELDSDRYRTERHEKGVAIIVDYPIDVRQGLEEGGGRQAQLALELYDLAFRAMKARDAEPDAEDPHEIWQALEALHERIAAEPRRQTTSTDEIDAIAAAAAAMVLAAHRGVDRDKPAVTDALSVLRDVADGIARAADAADEENAFIVREMAWSQGADRSAAMAVPILIFDEQLRERGGLTMQDVTELIKGLAASPSSEVRGRLVDALEPVWAEPCQDGALAHDAALATLRVLVATAGLGRWTTVGRRPRKPLAEPIEEALATSEMILEPGAASDAFPGLIAASRLPCAHGDRARRLLDVLVRYDLAVWPIHFARHHYEVGGWRDMLDRLVAGWILEGDQRLLDDYLTAFTPVPEELRGLLIALAAEATTARRAAVLHDIWLRIFDAFLPEAHARKNRSNNDTRRPFDHDVRAFDEALLPMQPANANWPFERTVALIYRWVQAYQGRPEVADQLIKVFAQYRLLTEPHATRAILQVLGDRIEDIRRDSRFVVAWLQLVLQQRPSATGQNAGAERQLLDRLAASGDEAAIHLQRTLET